MAAKKVSSSLRVPKIASPSKSVTAAADDSDYQSQDDAHQIMRYSSLRNNKDRFQKAMGHISSAASLGDNPEDSDYEDRKATQPRVTAKQGRRKLSRNMNRK